MASQSGAFTLLGRNWSSHSPCWVYVTLVAFLSVYLVKGAQGGCELRIRQRLRRSRPRNSLLLGAPDDPNLSSPESPPPDAAEWIRDLQKLSQQAARYDELRSLLPTIQSLLLSRKEQQTLKSCEKTRIEGLEAVTSFLSLSSPEEQPRRPVRDVFSSGEPVPLLSAREGAVTEWRISDKGSSIILDNNGNSFTVIPGGYVGELPSQSLREELVLSQLQQALQEHLLFNVNSLDTVECRFRIRTIQDVLLHPGQQETPLHDAGVGFSDYFLLYRPVETNLMRLVPIIQNHAKEYPEMRTQAKIAMLNLSLQLMNIVAQIRLKRVVLPRFSSEHIFLDMSGTLYLMPMANLRKEVTEVVDGSYILPDTSKNVWDTVSALLYVWCPGQPGASLVDSLTLTPVTRLEESLASCPSMPEPVKAMAAEMLTGSTDIDETRYLSSSYEEVEFLLQEEILKESEGAESLSSEILPKLAPHVEMPRKA